MAAIKKSFYGEVVTVMPNHDMHHRLMTVSDSWEYIDKLYPRIQSYAGEEKVASGVVKLLLYCVLNYVRDNYRPPSVYEQACALIPRWIEALVDDPVVVDEAKTVFKDWLGGKAI